MVKLLYFYGKITKYLDGSKTNYVSKESSYYLFGFVSQISVKNFVRCILSVGGLSGYMLRKEKDQKRLGS